MSATFTEFTPTINIKVNQHKFNLWFTYRFPHSCYCSSATLFCGPFMLLVPQMTLICLKSADRGQGKFASGLKIIRWFTYDASTNSRYVLK